MMVEPVRRCTSDTAQPGVAPVTVCDGLVQFRLMLVQVGVHALKSLATVNEQESLQPVEALVVTIQ